MIASGKFVSELRAACENWILGKCNASTIATLFHVDPDSFCLSLRDAQICDSLGVLTPGISLTHIISTICIIMILRQQDDYQKLHHQVTTLALAITGKRTNTPK